MGQCAEKDVRPFPPHAAWIIHREHAPAIRFCCLNALSSYPIVIFLQVR